MGDTCGTFQVEPPGPSTHTILTVVCPMGMVCRFQIVVDAPHEMSKKFGLCIPETAVTCNAADTPPSCPTGLACRSGNGIAPPGECFVPCRAHSDCRGPYQTCSESACGTFACSSPADAMTTDCAPGAHCERGICVKDATFGAAIRSGPR
jgi:hypothetical protein